MICDTRVASLNIINKGGCANTQRDGHYLWDNHEIWNVYKKIIYLDTDKNKLSKSYCEFNSQLLGLVLF